MNNERLTIATHGVDEVVPQRPEQFTRSPYDADLDEHLAGYIGVLENGPEFEEVLPVNERILAYQATFMATRAAAIDRTDNPRKKARLITTTRTQMGKFSEELFGVNSEPLDLQQITSTNAMHDNVQVA